MDIPSLGRILLVVGVVILIIGGLFVLFGNSLNGFPGTIRVEAQGVSCIVPILASIILSIVGTIVLNLVIRLINKP
jgi:hypothetical protein